MAKIINHFLTMNLTGSSFDHFYKQWSIIQSLINFIGLIVSIRFGYHQIWIAIVLSWFLFYIVNMKKFVSFPLYLGYANWVTIFRLSIVFCLGLSYQFLGNIVLFFGFLIAITLDGVDGFLARKFDQSSKAGEGLDMETDAFLVLLISWIHYDIGKLTWWILIPGGLRYYYGLTFFWLSNNGLEFPPKKVRASIAVIFFLALLFPFIFSDQISFYVLIIASSLIIFSFSASIIHRLFLLIKK